MEEVEHLFGLGKGLIEESPELMGAICDRHEFHVRLSGQQSSDLILQPTLDGDLLRLGHTAVAYRSEDLALGVAQT